MRGLLWFIFGLVCSLLSVGLILLAAGQPRGQPVILAPLPTPPPIVVQVDGAVQQPGIYTLPAGGRVYEAIQAAGGLRAEADSGSVNQAAILKDGERVVIPEQLDATPTAAPPPKAVTRPTTSPRVTVTRSTAKININTATGQQLETLPGIGPSLAHAILQYRQAHGAFKTIEAIVEVPGIGPKTFERIKDLITV